jgi:hypothetical protein
VQSCYLDWSKPDEGLRDSPHRGTAMPNLGVGPVTARDMAAYLYTLRCACQGARNGSMSIRLALELPLHWETASLKTPQSQLFRRAPW